MIVDLIEEAVTAGARRRLACRTIGLSIRTVQRWWAGPSEDKRHGPQHKPANALTLAERQKFLEAANTEEFRNLSPKQIVPALADDGKYIGSESTLYRLLREESQLAHRGRTKPRTSQPPKEHVAKAPNKVFSWDITYLPTSVRGRFYYLYLMIDVWSRKVMGWVVHEEESNELAAQLMLDVCAEHKLDAKGIVVHADNGGPMKGATMLATMQWLGIMPSFSRPHVSNDNPFSEALFRTLKYCPWCPSRPFGNLEEATAWVKGFVAWYNTGHLHSGIKFVTPEARHSGMEKAVLANRQEVYKLARQRHPERWTKETRDWTPVEEVRLNPSKDRPKLGEGRPPEPRSAPQKALATAARGPDGRGEI